MAAQHLGRKKIICGLDDQVTARWSRLDSASPIFRWKVHERSMGIYPRSIWQTFGTCTAFLDQERHFSDLLFGLSFEQMSACTRLHRLIRVSETQERLRSCQKGEQMGGAHSRFYRKYSNRIISQKIFSAIILPRSNSDKTHTCVCVFYIPR